MQETTLSVQNEAQLNENKNLQLSKQQTSKQQLLSKITSSIHQLQSMQTPNDKIQLLKLRKKLIERQGLSFERIENLQTIFLHYCTHIFKTGKHMTFDRLQYQKSHITMDRFFAFLSDFGLTTAVIDGAKKEVLDKAQTVMLFKKASDNCKDLTFEQFISCLQKIAILYYNSKETFKIRQRKMMQKRKRHKRLYQKNLKRRQAAMEAAKNRQDHNQPKNSNEEEEDKATNQQELKQPQKENQEIKAQPKHLQKAEKQQSQPKQLLVQNQKQQDVQLQEDKLQAKEIEPENAQAQQQITEIQSIEEKPNIDNPNLSNNQELLTLTHEEKVELFYQIIDVDNAASFKKKMRELDLPLFQNKHKRSATDKKLQGYSIQQAKQPKSEAQPSQEKRLLQLKNIIEERKLLIKANQPHMSKEDYEKRRKKRKIDQIPTPKRMWSRVRKLDLSELEGDLSSLSKMQFQKINFGKFNPLKLYQPSDQDEVYLKQYGSVRKPQKSQRVLSTLQATDKSSQMMLQKMKMRAQEIQTREKLQQSKYSIIQDINSTTQPQTRKNRLIQRVLMMKKQ